MVGYFNPRSHEGSDEHPLWSCGSHPVFQPALPRGERHVKRFCAGCLIEISTRAPTRGATQQRHNSHLMAWNFNPRSHEGSDYVGARHMYGTLEFQPALPRGERPAFIADFVFSANFNPRSHEGSDMLWYAVRLATLYFNPRSHEGSDSRESRWIMADKKISTRAPTRGATSAIVTAR